MELLHLPSKLKSISFMAHSPPPKRICIRNNNAIKSVKFHPENVCIISNDVQQERTLWSKNHAHPSNRMRTIISGSSDNDIKMWNLTRDNNANSQKSIRTLRGHEDLVWCFLIRHKTPLPSMPPTLISGSWDNTIKVWNLLNGDLMSTLDGHTSIVWCLTFLNEDESRLVSGSFDNTIKIWDLDMGVCLRTLLDHTSWIRCLLSLPQRESTVRITPFFKLKFD
jgi:WD40 repeat protein